MKAKKSLGLPRGARAKWGQNFLRDENILQRIADFAEIEKTDTVVEVGPGEGTLTKILLKKAGKVIAVEKDENLAELLKQNFREEIIDNRLQIIVGDILTYNLKSNGYKLIGNIPYYITGEIFRKFLENPPAGGQPKSLTFVVQKEVAERIMGSHFAKASRDKKESVLSISIKVYGTPEYGGVIKAGSFSPAPKVDSAIIAVRNIGKERFIDRKIDEKKFFEILKKGFAHKRKLLIKNLEVAENIFKDLGLDPKTRAEDLKVDDWFLIAQKINPEL